MQSLQTKTGIFTCRANFTFASGQKHSLAQRGDSPPITPVYQLHAYNIYI